MLHPVGPLPASVYWRRRAAAMLVTVVSVVVVVWISSAVSGSPANNPSAQQSALGSSVQQRTTPATSTTTAPTTTAPTTTSATPSAAPSTTQAPVPTTPAPTPSTPAPTPAAPPGAPPSCPDTAIGLAVQVAQPSYAVGEQPVFRIVITNTGAVGCTRNLDAALQQVLVYANGGATRLWSSNDCFPGKSSDVPTLAPGEQKVYSVKWAGTNSEPTCRAQRAPAPAGKYTAVAALGPLLSPPVPFALT